MGKKSRRPNRNKQKDTAPAALDHQALETNEACSRSNGSVHPHPAGETMNHESRIAKKEEVISNNLTGGDVYEGEWKDGQSSGNGKCTFASGDVYEGDWKDGKMNGKGKCTHTNGDVL